MARKKKYVLKKVNGVRVIKKIEGNRERPIFPKPAVFKRKTDYDRNREKNKIYKCIKEEI